MSEEKKHPVEENTPSPAETEKPRPTYKNTGLGRYLVVLFAAAFLLLLLAYFMQQRTNQETLGSLKESITSIESLDDLIKENQKLHDEINLLEETYETLEDAYETMENGAAELEQQVMDLTNQSETLKQTVLGWETFYQIETLYQNENYEDCARHIEALYADSTITIPDPVADRLEAIKSDLTDKGFIHSEN